MKILMVGTGGIGQRHMRNLRTILGDRVELLAYRVRGLSQVLTDQLQLEPGVSLEDRFRLRVFHDLDEALAQKPTAAFICNPTSLHVPVALRAARAGCHLFIEKPLGDGLDQARELVEEVERRSLVALVGYQLRFHPCLKLLHELLTQKAIGRLLAIRMEVGEYLPGWHTYEDYRQMYASRADQGGGVILSQIHEMDYLYWLLGMPRRVFTLGGQLSSLQIDVEDVASTLLDYRIDGRAVPVHLHQDYVQRPPSRTCQVIGDSGKILVDLRALTVNVWDGTGQLVRSANFEGFQRNQMFLDELNHFLACVRGEEKPLVSARDGYESLRMATAARESLTTGEVKVL